MHLHIIHNTRYEYQQPVELLPHLIYLRPRGGAAFHVLNYHLDLAPAASVKWSQDDLDNMCGLAEFSGTTQRLEIVSSAEVRTTQCSPFDFRVRDYALSLPFAYEPLHGNNLAPGCRPPNETTRAELSKWLDAVLPSRPTNTVSWLFELSKLIPRELRYERRTEEGIQSPTETIGRGSGSCRDYAQLYMDCARMKGLSARFVSGYHFDEQSPASVGEMHAWVEVYLPGAGWRGIDPTHGLFCDDSYVHVAHGYVSESVNPVQGAFVGPSSVARYLSTEVRITHVDRAAS